MSNRSRAKQQLAKAAQHADEINSARWRDGAFRALLEGSFSIQRRFSGSPAQARWIIPSFCLPSASNQKQGTPNV